MPRRSAPSPARERKRRRLALSVLLLAAIAAGLVAILVPHGSGSPKPTPTKAISISGAPAIAADGGTAGAYTYVDYTDQARISGIAPAVPGTPISLEANVWPYTSGFSVVARSAVGAQGKFAFLVKPALATSYRVALGARRANVSQPLTLYLGSGGKLVLQGTPHCYVKICAFEAKYDQFFPPSVGRFEARKLHYVYLGVLNRATGSPSTLNLLPTSEGRVTTTRLRTPGDYLFTVTIVWPSKGVGKKFQIGYNWCALDTYAQDGFGLPGHHGGCGLPSIANPAPYLG